jgi:thioredoxin 1
MPAIHANNENFKDLTSKGLVIVDFWASWCGPCRALGPILDEISDETEYKIVKVNVEEMEEITSKFGIQNLPTLIAIKDGEVVDKKVGGDHKQGIIDWIESL